AARTFESGQRFLAIRAGRTALAAIQRPAEFAAAAGAAQRVRRVLMKTEAAANRRDARTAIATVPIARLRRPPTNRALDDRGFHRSQVSESPSVGGISSNNRYSNCDDTDHLDL